MLNVIIGILLVSLASASGFMLIEQMSLTVAVADMRENSRRLDMAADAVSAKMGSPAGGIQSAIYVPAAKSGSGTYNYAQLPDSIPGIHTTVGGVPFRYCPYAPDTGAETVSPDGYLMKGAHPSNSDVAGFKPAGIIIAAGLKGATPAGCDDVRVVQGRLTVPGGLVRMISGVKGVADAQLTDGSSFEMWVAPDAGGTGSDAEHPASLVSAMNVWKGKLPKSMVIHVSANAVFADGSGALAGAFSMSSQPAGTIRSSKLSIVSGGGAIIAANATFDPQGGLALVGVSMPQTVLRLASHNQASLQSARVAAVDVQPGSAVAFNGGVSVQGGGINVAGDATVQGALEVVGSTSPDLITVPSGGRLILSGAGVTLRGGTSGVALAGDLAGSGTIVGAGTGVREIVRLVDGGRMSMGGSVGGAVSGYTILGDGVPASLGGTMSVGSGGQGCWAGDTFAFSTSASSRTVVPAQVAAPPVSEDGKADAAATNAFVENSNARSRALAVAGVNRSNWSCGA